MYCAAARGKSPDLSAREIKLVWRNYKTVNTAAKVVD